MRRRRTSIFSKWAPSRRRRACTYICLYHFFTAANSGSVFIPAPTSLAWRITTSKGAHCRLHCSSASWRKARVRGSTEENCREQLRRHLSNSHLHQRLQADGPEAIERIVSETEVKFWAFSSSALGSRLGFAGPPRERSRSRDSPPPRPSAARRTESPSPAPSSRFHDWVADDVVTIPAAELIEVSIALEVAAMRIRSLVDMAAQSFDV